MLRAEPHSKIGERNAMTKEEISSLRETLALMSPGPYCEGYMAGAIRHIVRNVDTDSFHDHATTEDCLSPGKHDGDSIAVALKLLPRALDALEEAHREIARLEKLALTGDSVYCAGCERVFPSAEINFTDEQDYCSPCLTEATKPRRAAVTVHVQGEGESVEAFLARCDAESTT